MKRVIVTSLFMILFGAVWQALGVNLPLWMNLFFLPPVVLVFSLQFFRPLETIILALLCGYIADVLGGFTIGTNMLMMLVNAFLLSAFNVFSVRIHRSDLVYYVMGISLIYRVLLLISQLIVVGAKTNIFLLQFIIGPLVDGLLGIIFFYMLSRTLALLKALDHNDLLKNRIGLSR